MLGNIYKLDAAKYCIPLAVTDENVLILHVVESIEGWTYTLLTDKNEHLWEMMPEISIQKKDKIEELALTSTLLPEVLEALLVEPEIVRNIWVFQQTVAAKQ